MADLKISALPRKAALATNDLIPIVDLQFGASNYVNKKTTIGDLVTAVSAAVVDVAGLITSVNGQTGTVVVGLNNLADTQILTPTGGEVLRYDAASGKWLNTALSDYAPLISGKIPADYLPSYVDDVVEAPTFAALPLPGEAGKIYVTLDTNKSYRWGGTVYVEISRPAGSTDDVPEGVVNLYYTDARVNSVIDVWAAAGPTFGSISIGPDFTISDNTISGWSRSLNFEEGVIDGDWLVSNILNFQQQPTGITPTGVSSQPALVNETLTINDSTPVLLTAARGKFISINNTQPTPPDDSYTPFAYVFLPASGAKTGDTFYLYSVGDNPVRVLNSPDYEGMNTILGDLTPFSPPRVFVKNNTAGWALLPTSIQHVAAEIMYTGIDTDSGATGSFVENGRSLNAIVTDFDGLIGGLVSTVDTFGTAAAKDVPETGDATITQVVLGSDTRLSNSREWIADTISQTEAETGTATTRRAWTALRVRQAFDSFWDSKDLDTYIENRKVTTTEFTVKGVEQGSYADNAVIPLGTSLETIIKNMLQKVIPATYVQPVLTISTANALTYEYGASPTITLSLSWAKNDAGAATQFKYRVAGATLQTIDADQPSPFDYTISSLQATVVFIGTATHDAGDIKFDNMGNPSPAGAIPAGTKTTSNSVTITPGHKRYWGLSSNPNITDEEIRALNSELATTRAQTRNDFTPVNQYIYIAYPASFGLATIKFNGYIATSAWPLTTRNFVNANGYTELYHIYRTNFTQNSPDIDIEVL